MARTRAQQTSEHRRDYADADASRPAVDPKASKKRSKSEHAKDVNDATELDGLAGIVRENYKGNLNNLLKDAIQQSKHGQLEDVRTAVRAGLQEIKGIGDVALDVFCDPIQSVWHELAPFLDPRSQQTAKDIGLPVEVEELYKDVNKDPEMMSRLAATLTAARLEGLHQEFA